MCCLTITIPHRVPKCGSLLTDVETGWLTDQFKVSKSGLRRSQKYSHHQILCPKMMVVTLLHVSAFLLVSLSNLYSDATTEIEHKASAHTEKLPCLPC